MRGSVTELMKNRDYGFLFGEDGRLIYFDETALEGSELRALSIGDWVEYEEQNRGERVRAVNVRPIARARMEGASRTWIGRAEACGHQGNWGVAMKVRELVARLASANPEDLVVIDTDSRWLLLLNQSSGMFQLLDLDEEGAELTERDKEFLSSLRVRF